ncbi:hypothetical protein A1D22_06010 [Pasteurellaceae bacterium LFhippo2]|nr:hypothetical protein [Pasteurellaceae bacterium LFhippo2]
MNEIKLNISIPNTMFKRMLSNYFSHSFHKQQRLKHCIHFIKQNWVLLDSDLRDKLKDKALMQLVIEQKEKKDVTLLSDFVMWVNSNRDSAGVA